MADSKNMKRLRELIDIELDNCRKTDWPYVCHMTEGRETRKELVDMIIKQIAQSGISVGQAIERVERAYNPNIVED